MWYIFGSVYIGRMYTCLLMQVNQRADHAQLFADLGRCPLVCAVARGRELAAIRDVVGRGGGQHRVTQHRQREHRKPLRPQVRHFAVRLVRESDN